MCSEKGLDARGPVGLIYTYAGVVLLFGLVLAISNQTVDSQALLQEPVAVALEFKPSPPKTKQIKTEYHSGPQKILVGFLADGAFAMTFEAKNGTVIAEYDCGRVMRESDVDSVIQRSGSLELKTNEYITSIVQETRGKPNPDTPVYVGIEIKTNSNTRLFENRKKSESDKLLNLTTFACPPGFMISSFECADNHITKAIAMPVEMVYHTTTEIGGASKKNCCRSKKFVLTTLVEIAVLLLDLISLHSLFLAFDGGGRNTLGYLRTGYVRPIQECILRWDDTVRPCLARKGNGCLNGHLKQGTEITFKAFADLDTHTNAGGCYTSSGVEIACSECMTGGNQTMECSVKNVVVMYPYTRFSNETYSLSTWNIEASHRFCVADATPHNMDYAFVMLALWKLMHITLEISLLTHEINVHRGIVQGISSLHLENLKTSKMAALIKSGWRPALGFFVSTPANYMYASLLTVGAPMTRSSTVGVEDFQGPGMWKAGSTIFVDASSYTVWLLTSILVFGGVIFPCALWAPFFVYGFRGVTKQKTHIAMLRQHFNFFSGAHRRIAEVAAMLFLLPFVFFFVIALVDSFSGSTISLLSLFSSVNVTLEDFSFDAVGTAVRAASTTFIAAMGRYIVMILHVQPRSVLLLCRFIGARLTKHKIGAAKATAKAAKLASTKTTEVLGKIDEKMTLNGNGEGIRSNAGDIEAVANEPLGGQSMGPEKGNVVIKDRAGELKDRYLKRFESEVDDTEEIKENIRERLLSKCCTAPVYVVALTPASKYQLNRSTVHLNTPNGIIVMRIPDEIRLQMHRRRVLLRVKLMKDKVTEVKQMPDVKLTLPGSRHEASETICLGGPEERDDY